jgi:hypothetical protein
MTLWRVPARGEKTPRRHRLRPHAIAVHEHGARAIIRGLTGSRPSWHRILRQGGALLLILLTSGPLFGRIVPIADNPIFERIVGKICRSNPARILSENDFSRNLRMTSLRGFENVLVFDEGPQEEAPLFPPNSHSVSNRHLNFAPRSHDFRPHNSGANGNPVSVSNFDIVDCLCVFGENESGPRFQISGGCSTSIFPFRMKHDVMNRPVIEDKTGIEQ